MGKVVWVFFILMSSKALAQLPIQDKLKGKVSSEMSNLEGIYVINLKTEKTVITEKEGYFSIAAAPGDTLLFSASQFKKVRVVLKPENFESEELVVKMQPILNQLKEVIVKRYDNINAAALGIIPYGQKKYTAAERKLYTATDLDAKGNAGGMAGGSVSGDPLLNYLSGRTAMLKKEAEVEKKESSLRLLDNLFDSSYFVNKLKIPSNYVKGFQYYIVENERFVVILKSKNKSNAEFAMADLAIKYNEIITGEK
jgi:arginine/ornithine N-succinyltransferase beta subunit